MEGFEFSLDLCISEEFHDRLFNLYEEFILSGFSVDGVSEEEFIKIF